MQVKVVTVLGLKKETLICGLKLFTVGMHKCAETEIIY